MVQAAVRAPIHDVSGLLSRAPVRPHFEREFARSTRSGKARVLRRAIPVAAATTGPTMILRVLLGLVLRYTAARPGLLPVPTGGKKKKRKKRKKKKVARILDTSTSAARRARAFLAVRGRWSALSAVGTARFRHPAYQAAGISSRNRCLVSRPLGHWSPRLPSRMPLARVYPRSGASRSVRIGNWVVRRRYHAALRRGRGSRKFRDNLAGERLRAP